MPAMPIQWPLPSGMGPARPLPPKPQLHLYLPLPAHDNKGDEGE